MGIWLLKGKDEQCLYCKTGGVIRRSDSLSPLATLTQCLRFQGYERTSYFRETKRINCTVIVWTKAWSKQLIHKKVLQEAKSNIENIQYNQNEW